jgi:hypothetical protein
MSERRCAVTWAPTWFCQTKSIMWSTFMSSYLSLSNYQHYVIHFHELLPFLVKLSALCDPLSWAPTWPCQTISIMWSTFMSSYLILSYYLHYVIHFHELLPDLVRTISSLTCDDHVCSVQPQAVFAPLHLKLTVAWGPLLFQPADPRYARKILWKVRFSEAWKKLSNANQRII